MITDRPEQLRGLCGSNGFTAESFQIDWSPVPQSLNLELCSLVGFQPLTEEYAKAVGGQSFSVPSDDEVEYFESIDVTFQLVQKVVSCYAIRKTEGDTMYCPYSISLFPASKRGIPSNIHPRKAQQLSSFPFEQNIYYGFDPFEELYEVYGAASTFVVDGKIQKPLDMIGFIDGAYFLAPKLVEAVHLVPRHFDNDKLNTRFRRFRKKRFFAPFSDVKPRRLWGCDSPIELFLLQAFSLIDQYPKAQVAIYEDGTLLPSLYHVFEDEVDLSGSRMVTEVDFYFEEGKLAVFCDSSFHRGARNQKKDQKIDEFLSDIGISVCRCSTSEIMENPLAIAETIANKAVEATAYGRASL